MLTVAQLVSCWRRGGARGKSEEEKEGVEDLYPKLTLLKSDEENSNLRHCTLVIYYLNMANMANSMGTAVSKRKNLRSDAISSVAAKVRAARAFGEYLSNTNPENRNGADHLLSDSFPGQNCDSPDVSRLHNNNLPPQSRCLSIAKPNQSTPSNPSAHPQPQVSTLQAQAPLGPSKRRLSVERSLSAEEPPGARGPEGSVVVKPAKVYTITKEGGMTLGGRGSEESLELEVLKGSREQSLSQGSVNQNPSCTSQPFATAACSSNHRSSHHRSNHHHVHQHHGGPPSSSQPLQSSGSASNIRDWGMRRGGSRDDYTPDCVACIRAPCQSQRSLDLDTSPRDGGKHRKKLERMYSEDKASTDDREDNPNSWFPKENMFSFQTATTTMQAAFRGIAERKRRKREQEAATMMERIYQIHQASPRDSGRASTCRPLGSDLTD
ncbi:NMDA receptor synaptonuclear signaling and neuronal migration factor [Larimichthys crocea]|uniref:Uncharacterized protein n=1 Tax=Larimichthys crocea TaxID=215358 RepID=A0ACD3Q889_LARCR|nr:NMDA receptor synaptonuclear signaling and neuronal migration factor [Larimichthys crocea]